MKKIKGFMLMLVVLMAVVIQANTQKVEAANMYIKVEDFIEYIVKEMEWEIGTTSEQPYIDVAMEKGILKKGDFKDYSEYLTRTDAAVIANRLDKYINLWYGYPQDVYEFLRDCTLYEGRLFYSTEGSLYPEGATRETYPEKNFHDEVVMPILGEYFKDDNWKDRGLRTGYHYVTDGNANIIKRYMIIGVKPIEELNFVEKKPFDENSAIVKAWNIIHDHDRKETAVLEKRISDIKDIPKSKREAVASIVAKGIIKGYSNGMYVQNREFRGNKKITDSGAKNVIQLVLNPDKRSLISPDGQLIRTTKLPKNYKEYKYILECFPNKYYEMKYVFMYLSDYLSGEIRDDAYAYPKDVDYDFLYEKFYHKQLRLETGKYGHFDEALYNVEKYLQHIFDVDYRTVNEKWKEGLASSLSFYSWDDSVYKQIERYIENIKKNKVVVELEKISFDSGTVYELRGNLRVRVYVKYRIIADDISVPTDQLIMGTYIKNIKKSEWREDIFDVYIEYRSENNIYKWAPSKFMPLDDWAYRDSFE
ncbi:MAG: S-layer homology domain-containing protein [Clostridiales bacterium]|nr:S-layer homology domain-containing protein [Clostridiales bacterium]